MSPRTAFTLPSARHTKHTLWPVLGRPVSHMFGGKVAIFVALYTVPEVPFQLLMPGAVVVIGWIWGGWFQFVKYGMLGDTIRPESFQPMTGDQSELLGG